MESWMFGGSGRVSCGISDEVFLPFDSTLMTKEAKSEWRIGDSCNPNNSILHTRQGAVENPAFLESSVCAAQEGIPEESGRGLLEHMSKEHGDMLGSLVVMTTKGEKEEYSKVLSSVVDHDAQDSSLIDLKLGRLSEWRACENSKSSKVVGNFSRQEYVNTSKRTRSSSTNGKTPLCQVHGCNMDLSSFKDYYKRHKVCQVHSKTANVVVNGIQQRFCQQCSRFHLLSEFDDGKRSCRKRLAGHNERRRKPQIVFQSGKSGMTLPCYGSNFLGSPLSNGILHNGSRESIDWSRLSGLNASSTNMQMQTSAFSMGIDSVSSRGSEKGISFANGNAAVPCSTYSVYASQYDSGIASSGPIFNAGDAIKDVAGVPSSSGACSLLSSPPASLCAYRPTLPVASRSNLHNHNASKSKSTTLYVGVDTPHYRQVAFIRDEVKTFDDLESQMQKNFHCSSHFRSAGSTLSHEHGETNLLQPSLLPQNAESRKM